MLRRLAALALLSAGLIAPAQALTPSVQAVLFARPVNNGLSLDGKNSGSTTAASLNVSLTTTKWSGTIVAAIISNAAVTSVTAGGLTFTLRATVNDGGSDFCTIYSAPYSSNFSGNITVNLASSTFVTMTAFGVGGASGFDADASLPKTAGGNFAAFNTSNARDFIYALSIPTNSPPYTAGTGWTLLNGTNFQALEYQIVTTTQAGLTPTLASSPNQHCSIGDAIR